MCFMPVCCGKLIVCVYIRDRQTVRLKASFPLANFFARSNFLLCLSLISFKWLHLKARGQREKSLRGKKFACGSPAKLYCIFSEDEVKEIGVILAGITIVSNMMHIHVETMMLKTRIRKIGMRMKAVDAIEEITEIGIDVMNVAR